MKSAFSLIKRNLLIETLINLLSEYAKKIKKRKLKKKLLLGSESKKPAHLRRKYKSLRKIKNLTDL